VSDFAVIRTVCILRPVRLRRTIRTVRIVQMQPEKKWLAGHRLQPRKRVIDTLPRLPLDQPQLAVLISIARKNVIIKIKHAGKAPALINNARPDDGGRTETIL